MHRTITWLLLGLALASQGCAMSRVLARNVVTDPLHYDYESDSLFRKLRYGSLAETAWERAQESAPQPYSKHYGRGFKQAFSDYLDGGEGNTPLVPPRRYWAMYYQSPEGNEAIQDWFAGWRHGVAAARESGYRNLVVIPTIYQPSDGPSARFDLNTGSATAQPPSAQYDLKTGEPRPVAAPRPTVMDGEFKTGAASKPSDAPKLKDGAQPRSDTPQPVTPTDAPRAGEAIPPIKPPVDGAPKAPAPPMSSPAETPKRPSGTPDKPTPETEQYEPLVSPEKR